MSNFSLALDTNGPKDSERLAIGVLIWKIFPPFLLCFGTVGNVLSILVLSRRKLYKTVQSIFLIALTMADLTVLHTGLLSAWIGHLIDIDVSAMSPTVCKVMPWLIYSTADISVWILVALTIERVMAVSRPISFRGTCSNKTSTLAVVFVCCLSMSVNSHFIFGLGSFAVTVDGTNITVPVACGPLTPEYGSFVDKVWPAIDLCKFSIGPFIILTTGNLFIIRKICVSSHRSATQVVPIPQVGRHGSVGTMSKLLVALNFVFILCTAPIGIYMVANSHKDAPIQQQMKEPGWALVNLILYLNNTTNFLLYCVSGSRFRAELKVLFCRKATIAIHPLTVPQEQPQNTQRRNPIPVFGTSRST